MGREIRVENVGSLRTNTFQPADRDATTERQGELTRKKESATPEEQTHIII